MTERTKESKNPLLLNVILDNIFEVLPLKDLLTCRNVCKTWCCNTKLKNQIREKSKVSIRKIFLQTSATSENISDYFLMSGPIYAFYNFANISFSHTLVTRLFEVLGPTIRTIRLHLNLHQLNIDQFRILLYERLPNLEELVVYSLSSEAVYNRPLLPPGYEPRMLVNLKRVEFQEVRTSIEQFLGEFFKTTPNLKSVILKTEICSDWSEQADVWRHNSVIAWSVLKALHDSGNFKSLKEFRCGKLRKRMVEQLLTMGLNGLQLEILEMHAPPKDYEEAITAFLKMQRDSLKELILFEQRSYTYKSCPVPNPDKFFMLKLPDVMPQLEVLQFSKYRRAVMVPMHYTDFERQCPRLRKLVFLGFDYGQSPCANLYIPEKPAKSVNELDLWALCDDRQLRQGFPEVISKSFPNLTKLTVSQPNGKFLKALWGHCENLQKLMLMLPEKEYLDEAITGVPEGQIARWINQPDTFKALGPPDPKQSIVNLKNLQMLEIIVDYNDEDERQALCDATAYFALGSMKQLRYLTLYSSDWRTGLTSCLFFSKKCEIQLRQVLKHTVIHFVPPPDDE